MKKFKKALAVLLAGVLALAMLTACGGGADGGKEPQHVTGAFDDTSKVTIGKVEVSSCTVEAYSMAQSPEKYKGYEYIAVTFGVRNQSEAPLDLERSASEWFQMSSASATDFDAAYDGWFAKESKYLTAKVDGKAAKASGYCLVLGQGSAATIMESQKYGSTQLIVLAPEGWTSLDVTFAPSNANGESAVFHLTQADVSKRMLPDGTLVTY